MPDLRAWLDDVEKIGQLMKVTGIDWDLELSTLTEVINERAKNRPAIVFDKTNSEEVIWAISSRSDPAASIEILRRCWSGPLDPRIAVEDKGFSSRAIIDATRPYEWRDKFPKSSGASRELKDKVAGRWRALLDEKFGAK